LGRFDLAIANSFGRDSLALHAPGALSPVRIEVDVAVELGKLIDDGPEDYDPWA
jgi:hypothetical protein